MPNNPHHRSLNADTPLVPLPKLTPKLARQSTLRHPHVLPLPRTASFTASATTAHRLRHHYLPPSRISPTMPQAATDAQGIHNTRHAVIFIPRIPHRYLSRKHDNDEPITANGQPTDIKQCRHHAASASTTPRRVAIVSELNDSDCGAGRCGGVAILAQLLRYRRWARVGENWTATAGSHAGNS